MAGKDNTTRIEALESRVYNLAARLDVLDVELKGIAEVQTKGVDTTAGHTTKIIVIEQQLLVLVALKESMAMIATIEKDLVAIKKDVETNAKWQEEEKKRQETWGQRFWMILPPLLLPPSSVAPSLRF